MLQQQYNDSMGNHKNISMYALYMGKIRKYNICPPSGEKARCVPLCPKD